MDSWTCLECTSLPLPFLQRSAIYLCCICGLANVASWVSQSNYSPCVFSNNGFSPLHSFVLHVHWACIATCPITASGSSTVVWWPLWVTRVTRYSDSLSQKHSRIIYFLYTSAAPAFCNLFLYFSFFNTYFTDFFFMLFFFFSSVIKLIYFTYDCCFYNQHI